jgi:nitrilase
MKTRKKDSVQVSVIQASSVLFNKTDSTGKACALIRHEGEQGADLILLPEAFIPAYPRGFNFGSAVGYRKDEGRELFLIYYDNAVDIPGPETDLLCQAASEAGAYVAAGVIERSKKTGGTLYCTLLVISPEGHIVSRHRKIKPTGVERLIWGEGDGSDISVIDTPFGRVGGLICWENYMPLARCALYQQGIDIYLAPTADSRESWQASMKHIACEGRCFVLGSNQYVEKSMVPEDLPMMDELNDSPEIMCSGGSAIVSPLGDVIAGPLFGEEGVLRAELNLSDLKKARMDFDVFGHYSRPDVFKFEYKSEYK